MTDERSEATSPRPAAPTRAGGWAWHPPLPLVPVPVFVWELCSKIRKRLGSSHEPE